jgi:AmmeMemoRadiSam system protein A
MSSNESSEGGWLGLSPELEKQLLDVAVEAIRHEIELGVPLRVDPADYPSALRRKAATFVTLRRDGELVGCIGTLQPRESLVESVATNAGSAAFRDPRDLGPRPRTTDDLDVHVSILSPMEPMVFASEDDLLRQLRPGVDGLLLEEGYARGTFLPSVWEQVPDPRDFLAHLKMKAGLPPTYWSDRIRVSRYTAESFGV